MAAAPSLLATVSALGIFIAAPWLALVPAGVFAALGYRSRRWMPWITAILWLLYAVYEMAMKRRILCTGECNIRVDLLLLYPLLLLLSIAAAVSGFRGRRPPV